MFIRLSFDPQDIILLYQTRLCANSVQTSQISYTGALRLYYWLRMAHFSIGCTRKPLSLLPSDMLPVRVVSTEPVGQADNRLSHQQLTSRVALASGKKKKQWSSRTRKPSSVSETKGVVVFSNDRKPEYRRDQERLLHDQVDTINVEAISPV